MPELDDITEEELALAERLARELDEGHEPEDASLAQSIALLKASQDWEPHQAQLRRTRADVEQWADKAQVEARQRAPKRLLWLAWLPLPAVALLALVYGLKQQNAAEPPLAQKTADTEPGESAEADPMAAASAERWHAGEVPAGLLQAQAELLAARSAKKPFDRSRFDREMSHYRAQLLARVEMEGGP